MLLGDRWERVEREGWSSAVGGEGGALTNDERTNERRTNGERTNERTHAAADRKRAERRKFELSTPSNRSGQAVVGVAAILRAAKNSPTTRDSAKGVSCHRSRNPSNPLPPLRSRPYSFSLEFLSTLYGTTSTPSTGEGEGRGGDVCTAHTHTRRYTLVGLSAALIPLIPPTILY